jgi:hypothetical protein
MRATRIRLVVIVMVTMLVSSEVGEAQGQRMTDVLPGVWDWEEEPKWCKENPHSIKFTAGGSRMEVRHPKGAVIGDEPPSALTVYRILAEGPSSLRMEVIGETRKTESGNPVVWDLILLSSDSYCWRRTDWPPQECTGRVLRCPLSR